MGYTGSPVRDAVLESLKKDGPATVVELAERLGKSRATISMCVTLTHKAAPESLHVLVYRRRVGERGKSPRVWVYGPGDDATPPAPISKAEAGRRRAAILRRRRRQVSVEAGTTPAEVVVSSLDAWMQAGAVSRMTDSERDGDGLGRSETEGENPAGGD